jgi:hypothetical protein
MSQNANLPLMLGSKDHQTPGERMRIRPLGEEIDITFLSWKLYRPVRQLAGVSVNGEKRRQHV